MNLPGRRFWLAEHLGSRSLKRQLLLWLLLPQLVLWLAGALFTYQLAGRYAAEAVDASLLQATRSLARQVKPLGNGLLIDFPRAAQDVLEADPSDKLLYTVSSPPGQFILGNGNLPEPPLHSAAPRLGTPYFYDGELSETPERERPGRIRVAALYLHFGEDPQRQQTMLVQVARSSANREELARRLLIDTVLPLSVLIVLMSMIVWAGVSAGLAPLTRLRKLVEGRAPNDLHAIELNAAPPELRSLAQAINALLDAVQGNVQAQRRFISDAAHQLRTPLAGLKSQTELALAEAGDPARQAQLQARLLRVHESATRSAHLVNQLLALARTEPESAPSQPLQRVDLARLARELTAELVPRALQGRIDLGFGEAEDTGPDGAPAAPSIEVMGSPLLLREALLNLIDNALRYAGAGSTVTVQVERRQGQALFTVSDNGPGIPEPLRGRVFERFFRATHEGNGCGLGLAIVKEIAERHGGSVQVQGLHPQGLQVSVSLPIAHQAPQTTPSPRPARPATARR